MVASRWPRVTWSAGRTTDVRDPAGDRGRDDVLHLHRLEGDDRVAGGDGLADRGVDRQDGAGHRRHELDRAGRPGRAMGDGRARRRVDVGRRRQPERDAPAGEVEMDGAARADGRDRVARGRAARASARRAGLDDPADPFRLEPDRAPGVEPPAAGPRIGRIAGRPAGGPPRRSTPPRGSPCAPPSRPAARSGSACRSAPRPARTTGWRTSQRRNRRFVTTPEDDGPVEGAREPLERRGPVRPPGDDLGQHRVEPAADLAAELDPGVDADALAGRPARALRPARSPAGSRPRHPRHRAGPRRRGRWRCAGRRRSRPSALARGDPQLVGDEVAPGHEPP